MKTINTINELINLLSNAKNGGRFVTIECETDVKLNKFPTDGSEKVRINDGFQPKKRFSVQFHFGQDYEKTMEKALGVDDYQAHDSNRRHILKNVLMQYISTGNICLIYMPTQYVGESVIVNNGKVLTKEEVDYMKKYQPKYSSNQVKYNTCGVKNIKTIVMNGETYIIDIVETIVRQAV